MLVVMLEEEEEAKDLEEAIQKLQKDLGKLIKKYDQHAQKTAQTKEESERIK